MSKFLPKILSYFIWTLCAFLFAFVYMRIVLGGKPESSTGFMKMFDWIYEFAFVYIGTIIASIIMLLYALFDIFYLNKKLKNSASPTSIRLLVFIVICILVVVIHYVLEKVIDVI